MRRLAFFMLMPLSCLAAETMPPPADQQLARDIYKQLIEIKSGYSTGATTPVAEAMAARFRAAGFPDSDIFLGGAAPNKSNLVVRYRGSGERRPLLLLAHTDVVEAKREDWSVDPFQFIEREGYFYGRGTTDDKAQAAVWVATLLRMKREGIHANRDIILALTADEEGGGPYDGADWLIRNHRDLIDAELCLNEGGWGEVSNGKKIANDVQVSEKYVINFRLEVHNKGGHSSLPVADNAIYHLSGALTNLSKFAFPLKTNDVTRAYFEKLASIQAGPLAKAMSQVSAGSQSAMAQVAAASPVWNATLRTTCVATELEGGHAINALPQLAAGVVNCRVLPDDSIDYVKTTLTNVLNNDKVELKIVGDPSQGPSSPLEPALMHTIQRITDSLWPGVPVLPTMVPGATDGKYLRLVGIPTYGVQGFFLDVNDLRMHGRDERMPIESFYHGQAFLYELVTALSVGKS